MDEGTRTGEGEMPLVRGAMLAGASSGVSFQPTPPDVRSGGLIPMSSQPSRISRYEIKSRLGGGGMGDLYLALDPNTNRLVALKLLKTVDSAVLRERFAREARALAALNHPNIVNIYDTGEYEDSPFIVMEYIRGETLAEMIRRRAPLSVADKLKLMEELCAGLAQAHEAGIIHRDIKPANLMVDQQNRLKILDFGIARVAEASETRVGMPLTQVNIMIGTPGYMSPEQIEGGDVDHRSDIFAVGAVCYELLSYDEAFGGQNTRQIEAQVLRGQPKPLISIVPGLDPELDEVVARALKRDPNKRYQDAATFERALARVRARLGPDAQDAGRRPTPPPPNPKLSREARADAAFQRAIEAERQVSRDAARRHAVEALAEDPNHAGARALLARLDPRLPRIPETPYEPKRPPQGQPTVASTAIAGSGETVASTGIDPSVPTVVSTAAELSASTVVAVPPRPGVQAHRPVQASASAPTIVVTPPKGRTSPSLKQRWITLWGRRKRLPRHYEAHRRPDALKRSPAGSSTSRWILMGIVLAVITVSVLVMVIAWAPPSGQLLTIVRPVGGTISAAGIRCGTRGADCATKRPKGEAIELTPEPDTGYAFAGYTGDCAPGGRTVMSAARTCGATFELMPAAPADKAGPTQVLTISPVPTGGTVEGVGILCGTKGSECSTPNPEGVPVELHAVADEGFTFMGFNGDCTPGGHTQMNGARTCGAKFSPTVIASQPPPAKPLPVSPSASRRGGPTAPPVRPGVDAPPPTPAPAPPVVEPVGPGRDGKPPLAPPPTDDEFAKKKIKELLAAYCAAYEAMDPDAVQQLFPKVDIKTLRIELNRSKYKSVQCQFGEPEFLALDAASGTARVRAELKQTFEHTAGEDKPQKKELVVTITLVRSGPRASWLIDSIRYVAK
jgi:serine/threonine-protein kinase